MDSFSFLRGGCVVRLVGRRARVEADVNKRVLCCDWLDNKSLTSLYILVISLVRRYSSEVSYWFM